MLTIVCCLLQPEMISLANLWVRSMSWDNLYLSDLTLRWACKCTIHWNVDTGLDQLELLYLEGNPLAYAPFYRLDVLSWAPSPLLKLDGVITQKEEREAAGLRVAGQIPLAWQIMSEFVGQRELLWRPPKRVSQQAYHGHSSHGCSAFVNTYDLPSDHKNLEIPICCDCQVCCHRLPFSRDVEFLHQMPTNSVHRVF